MPNEVWRILFVDDEEDICGHVKEYLEASGSEETTGGNLIVETVTKFDSALDELQARLFDLVILDVRGTDMTGDSQQEAGTRVLDDIRGKRFVPVVFYTGLPHLVSHEKTPLVRVVEKTQGLSVLFDTVKDLFETGLPQVNRELVRHMERVQRDYMWGFVAENWHRYGETQDRRSLAYMLARRLAMSLSGPRIQQLAQRLGDTAGPFTQDERVHPMQYYLLPPVEDRSPEAGDLYYGEIGDETGYWILLTPSCDLVAGREKADHALFAPCDLLDQQPEFKAWKDVPNRSNIIIGNLTSLLRDNRRNAQPERFFYLPGVFDVPDLIVDFQRLETLPREEMHSLDRKASLDSPFSEAILSRFTRYSGRLGTPDLDVERILEGL